MEQVVERNSRVLRMWFVNHWPIPAAADTTWSFAPQPLEFPSWGTLKLWGPMLQENLRETWPMLWFFIYVGRNCTWTWDYIVKSTRYVQAYVKLNVPFCITWRHVGKMEVCSTILNLGTEWSASQHGLFFPENGFGVHGIGGWVGHNRSEHIREEKNLLPLSGFDPQSSSP
jgi:hypothetical protein